MLENSLVLLPTLTNIHHLTSLQINELIMRESKKQKFNLAKTISKRTLSKIKKEDVIKEVLSKNEIVIIEEAKRFHRYKKR